MNSSSLFVFEVDTDLAAFPLPEPNSNVNLILRADISLYEIIEPFTTVEFKGLGAPLTVDELKSIKRILATKGSIVITGIVSDRVLKITKTNMLLSGYIIESVSENKLFGINPAFSPGAAVPLKPISDDSELINEDDLLTEEDKIKPTPTMDCGPGNAKKACKNCSCGMAELEAKEKDSLKTDTTSAKSSCGNVSFLLRDFISNFYSAIWEMHLDALVVRIVDCLHSKPVNKSRFPRTSSKMTFKHSLLYKLDILYIVKVVRRYF